MVQPEITILTVNFNSSHFIELMLYSFHKLTLNPYQVYICDNGSSPKHITKLIEIAKKYPNVNLVFRDQSLENEGGSVAHGKAMDLLISKVSTPYFILMDADATFLKKHWDDILIKEIEEKTKLIGTPYPKESTGIVSDDFPVQFAVLVETKTYQNLNISCMPRDISKEDTCWEWKPAYLTKGFNSKIFTALNTRHYKGGPFKDMIGVIEYYWKEYGLIASHFGRGSSGGAAKYKHRLLYRIPVISDVFRKYKGKRDINKWIKVCCHIIKQQT